MGNSPLSIHSHRLDRFSTINQTPNTSCPHNCEIPHISQFFFAKTISKPVDRVLAFDKLFLWYFVKDADRGLLLQLQVK